MKKLAIIPVLFLFILSSAQTQIKKSSIDNGGATSANGNINIVFTLGESFIAETTNGNTHVSEGFIGKDFRQTSDIKNIFTTETVNLYPNPADDILFIAAKSEIKSVSISDITGKNVLRKYINSQNAEIKVYDLQNGIYIINIETNNFTLTKKFIKQ
ncbi:MAG: T9SS type A sorting domain-containing protein [Chlorobi bacterium]|nr:T9SS type A sorting domain-containing protein [Chlorobiota bacterium]